MKKVKVLALLGQWKHSRADNEQTLTLSREIAKDGVLYEKSIYFNFLINLPPFLLSFIPIWLMIKHNEGFTDIDTCDIIVTSGRKMIRYAKHLKKYAFPEAKIVQIGKSYCSNRNIDIFLLPEHCKTVLEYKNLIRYRGLLCEKLNQQLAKSESGRFSSIKDTLKGPFIGVFIGNDTIKYKMSSLSAIDFSRIINNISHNMNMPLLIATDEKVSKSIINKIKENLDCSYYFYEKKLNPLNSPKVAFMHWSDYYILIGDNINDHSEYLMQQKPTYIYFADKHSNKYTRFYDGVIENGVAKVLDSDTQTLKYFEQNGINNITKIANNVIKMIKEIENN